MKLIKEASGGNVTIVSLMAVIGLSMIFAFCVYLSNIYMTWSFLDCSLDASESTILGTSFQMKLKSSEEPEREIAYKIASSFRSMGCDEQIVVWVYESKDSSLKDNVRAISVTAQTTFPINSFTNSGPIDITCEKNTYLVPYSNTVVYKPSTSDAVSQYIFPANSSSATLQNPSLQDCPASLKEGIDKAIATALEY